MPAQPEPIVGDGDPDLDARLSEELTRCDVPAPDARPQREATSQVVLSSSTHRELLQYG